MFSNQFLTAARQLYFGSGSRRCLLLNITSQIAQGDSLAKVLRQEVSGNGYTRQTLGAISGGGVFSPSFSASGGAISYNAIAIVKDCLAASSIAATLDSATNIITTSSAHGLSDGMLASLSGTTFPTATGVTVDTETYADVLSATTLKLHTNAGLSAEVDWTTNGSGLRLNLGGTGSIWEVVESTLVPSSIASGTSSTINISLSGVNV